MCCLILMFSTVNHRYSHTFVIASLSSEENSSIEGVGVEKLLEVGKLDKLKGGPLFWIDSADSQPCMGTATAMMWTLRAEGRLFHSGLPHKGINSLEMAMEAVNYVQTQFYKDFPAHADEERYKFSTPSTMKPTQMRCSEGSVNQVPPWTEIQGDIRLTPFYEAETCLEKVEGYVETLNNDLSLLPTRGPCSKYTLDIPEVIISLWLTHLNLSQYEELLNCLPVF
jgi:acetylornithine deacetylase